MPRLSVDTWLKIRADYEIGGLSYTDIKKKYNVARSSISKVANKDGWIKSKSEHLIDERVNAIHALKQSERKSEQLNEQERTVLNDMVTMRLRFQSSALINQDKADEMLQDAEGLSDVNQHSQITARNMESVIGKQPTQQVNIQNNMKVRVINPFDKSTHY